MKFYSNFFKLNYSVMAFILAFQVAQGNSLAMMTDWSRKDPVAGNETLLNNMKKHFNCQPKDTDNSIMSITYPSNSLSLEKGEFVLSNSKIKKFEDIIDPNDYKDHRMIKFYNIPALLEENKNGSNSKVGASNGNLTIKLMIDLYMQGMAKSQDVLEDLRDKNFNFRVRMAELSKKFDHDLQTDYNFKSKIRDFANCIGTDFKTAKDAYFSVIICQTMIDELSNDLEERTKLGEEVTNVLKKLATPGAIVAGGALGFASGAGLTALGAEIGTAIFPGVGTAIGGILGWAIATAVTAFSSVKMSEGAAELGEEASQRNKNIEFDANETIELAANLLSQQRALNYAKLIRQVMHFMINKPKTVLKSNVFVTAVDNRNFLDITKVKQKKDWKLAVKLAKTEDQESWCDFKEIPDLKNAPYAEEYHTKDNRSIRFLLDIFKSTFSSSDNTIDYKKLSKYANGTQLPLSFMPDVVEKIRENLEDEVSENKIKERIKKKVPYATDDEISNLIQEEKSRMNSPSHKYLPQYASEK